MILDSCSADEVLLISSTISVSLCWAPHVLRWPSLLLWVPSPMVTSHWHGWWNPDFSVHQALEMIQQSLLPITPNKGSREVSQRQLSLSFSLWFSVGLFWFPSASSDTSVKVAQLFLTLCDPMDCSLPGSPCPWNFPGKNTGSGLPFPCPWWWWGHWSKENEHVEARPLIDGENLSSVYNVPGSVLDLKTQWWMGQDTTLPLLRLKV